MKLDALDRMSAVSQPHDQAIAALGGDLQLSGQRQRSTIRL